MKFEGTDTARPLRWLYAGFVLTGTGTTLLGCILPALITALHMNDARAGLLFAAQFAGSALGALFVGQNYFVSLTRGYVLLVVSAVSIGVFFNFQQVVLFWVFGLGLGLTMTSTSMLVSALFTQDRGAKLSLLNAFWGLGAVLSPAVASVWLAHWSVRGLFLTFAVTVLLVFSLIRRHQSVLASHDRVQPNAANQPVLYRSILVVAFVAFLYVGVEVAVSGWLMSFAHRVNTSSNPWPPIIVTCFWIALIAGRAIAPELLRRISEMALLTASVGAALLGVSFLLLSRSSFGIMLCAACSGIALGPIYPLCLARVMALAHDSPNTKWVFATSGLGGALLPWLSGIISAYNGSLRVGLLVPLLALGTMLILQIISLKQKPAGRPNFATC